jgi:hypothetical protein
LNPVLDDLPFVIPLYLELLAHPIHHPLTELRGIEVGRAAGIGRRRAILGVGRGD